MLSTKFEAAATEGESIVRFCRCQQRLLWPSSWCLPWRRGRLHRLNLKAKMLRGVTIERVHLPAFIPQVATSDLPGLCTRRRWSAAMTSSWRSELAATQASAHRMACLAMHSRVRKNERDRITSATVNLAHPAHTSLKAWTWSCQLPSECGSSLWYPLTMDIEWHLKISSFKCTVLWPKLQNQGVESSSSRWHSFRRWLASSRGRKGCRVVCGTVQRRS